MTTETAGDPESGGNASAAGKGADPVARDGKALAQAGGPRVGEPAAGGPGHGSGPDGREPGPARPRPEARAGTPASNSVAPPARTAMDGDVEASERGGRAGTNPDGRPA